MYKKPIYQLKQDYLSLFKSNSLAKAINELKSLGNVLEMRNVVDCIKSVYGKLPKDIEGVLYPKTLSELSHISSKFYKPISSISEINWFISYTRGNWPQLRWFAEKKVEYEQSFLLGQFHNCHTVLDEIKDRLGISLWLYEQNCVLLEYEGRSRDSMNLISDVLKSCGDNNNYIPWLAYYLFERSSRKLSPFKFDEDLNALYKKNKTDLHEDYYKYILFRLNYYNRPNDMDFSLPVMFESISSLVDRYLIVISVIKASLVHNINDDIIVSRGLYLYKKTNDKSLIPIIALNKEKMSSNYYNAHYMEIVDSFYQGYYEKCRDLSKSYLMEDASCFDACIYYCRSLIYLSQQFEIPYRETRGAPINELALKVYNVLTYKDAQDSLYSLYQINKNLSSFYISADLDYFYKVEQNEPVNKNQKFLNINHFDPEFSGIWSNEEDAYAYINSSSVFFKSSTACKVWLKSVRHEYIDDASLPEHIIGPVNIEYFFRNKTYDKSYSYSEKLYLSAPDCVPIRQIAVAKMVECLACQNEYQKAISLYVNYFLKDIPSVVKVDTQCIIQHLQDNLYEGVRRNIDLVIFVALACKEIVDKSYILLEFCELKGVKKPSELIDILDPQICGIDKLELFYSLLDDDEILKNYSIIESYEERLNERKKILQYIISFSSPRKETYQVALKKIEDALLVYNFSHNLDESKIYANEEAIISYKLSELGGKYGRYRMLVDTVIQHKEDIYFVDVGNTSLFDDQNYEEESKTDVAISSNGLYDIFHSLYLDIKEQFLYSDYGLVAYLSTRVRHGELESALRPELAKRHLILSTLDNIYQEDTYWKNTYSLGPDESNVILSALQKFSKEFDTAVTSLIKQNLQIYDKENKPNGLFNYEVSDKESALKAVEFGLELKAGTDSKDAFCHLMINWLWEKTEESLSVIRSMVDTEFKVHISQLIEELKTALREGLPEGHARNDMLSELRAASEAISTKIQKISKWFNVSHSKLENVDFSAVSLQIFNSVKQSHTNCQTNDVLNIIGDSFLIRSDYVIHYADILRNILTNIFVHGVDSTDGFRHMKLDININSDEVRMSFENFIDSDADELNHLFDEKLNNCGFAYFEGGSGIAKVNKILKQDLNCKENEILMHAEKNICYTNVVIKLANFKVS